MKTKKLAVYTLSAVLCSLMMLAYWLTKTTTWVPAYSPLIDNLLIVLLALAGGNIALIIFDNKMSADIAAGIMAITMFPLLLIRSEALFIFTLGWAPVSTFLIVYSWFQKRSRSFLMNFAKIFAAGVSALVLNLLVLFVIVKNVPDMTRGEYGGLTWFVLNIGFGCIESIVLIIVLIKSYALQNFKG